MSDRDACAGHIANGLFGAELGSLGLGRWEKLGEFGDVVRVDLGGVEFVAAGRVEGWEFASRGLEHFGGGSFGQHVRVRVGAC